MKGFVLVALAGAALLSGCAADGTQSQGTSTASRGDAPLGSYIRSKSTAPAQPSGQADMQALENARIQGNGTINLPQH